MLTIVVGMILWDRRYLRQWQSYRSRNWPRVQGQLDEGEVVTMKKGRSGTIAGYEVWFGYVYDAYGGQVGVFTTREFRQLEDAEACLKKLANRRVQVRISPSNPAKSCVIEEDIELL